MYSSDFHREYTAVLFQLLAIEEIIVIRVKRNFSGAFHRPEVARMKDARLGPERELDETIYNILC